MSDEAAPPIEINVTKLMLCTNRVKYNCGPTSCIPQPWDWKRTAPQESYHVTLFPTDEMKL